jgi:Fe-S cluster assembly protein SufD
MNNNSSNIAKSDKNNLLIDDFNLERGQIQSLEISSEIKLQRLAANKLFETIPLPTNKNGAWRKANLRNFHPNKFNLTNFNTKKLLNAPQEPRNVLSVKDTAASIKISTQGIDIRIDEDLRQKGVILCGLLEAERYYPDIVKQIKGKIVETGTSKFSALTSAYGQTGVFLYIPQNIKIEKPISSTLWGEGDHQLYAPHFIIFIDSGSSATFIKSWIGKGSSQAANLSSNIVEIQVNANANLNFIEMQSETDAWWNISHAQARICENGKLNWFEFGEGGYYSKNFISIDLSGERSSGTVTGIYLSIGRGQRDYDTFQYHAAPFSRSDLLFKGVLANEGKTVWSGMIKVAFGADHVYGYQVNRNLLICGDPQVVAIPGLEILNDDVRCSHGVSVGEIDPEQIFYLRSRGISEGQAKQLIAEGFIQSAFNRISEKSIQTIVSTKVHQELMNLLCV